MALEITENNMAEPILPEMQDISRQRDLAKLLLQKGMADNLQGQMVSGRYVGASPIQGIANIYSAYKGNQMIKEADRKQAELAEMLRAEGDKDLMAYGEAVTPKPAVEGGIYGPDNKLTTQTTADMFGANMELNPQYKEVAAQAAVEPDYATGMRILRKSKDPETRQLAKLLMADQMKTLILPEGSTAIRGSLFGKGGQSVEGKPKLTELQRDYNFAKTPEGGNFKGNFTDYDLMRRNASSQRINVQNALPFQEQIYTDTGKALIEDFKTLKSIPSQVKQLDRVADIAPKSFAGSFADTKLQTVKFFNNNLGTSIASDKVNNTEELRAVLFTNLMDNLKKLDASPSQEQQRVMQASLGNIGTDPNALPAVVNVYKQILLDKVGEHNERVNQTVEKGFKYPYDIRVNVAKPNKNEGGIDTGDGSGRGWRVKP
jgi:hypothetical protein